MARKLKTLIRKFILRKKDSHVGHPRVEQRPQTAPRVSSDKRQTVPTTPPRQQTQGSAPIAIDTSSPGDSNNHRSQRYSIPPSLSEDKAAPVTDKHAVRLVPQEENSAVADNHNTHLPAVAPETPEVDAQHISLGGNSRAATNGIEEIHNEDIADRNISMYAADGPQSLLANPNESQKAHDQVHDTPPSDSTRTLSTEDNSFASTGSTASQRYTGGYVLDTEVVSDSSFSDDIMAHVKGTDNSNSNLWPSQIKHKDAQENGKMRKLSSNEEEDFPMRHSVRCSVSSRYSEKSHPKHDYGPTEFQHASVGGQHDKNGHKGVDLDGIVDLRDTEDIEKKTRWAPAVTHEVVKPAVHEIVEERAYKEIHNHDIYRRVLPVYETEILPARHFINDSSGALREVSEDQIPGWTGQNQRWFIGEKQPQVAESLPSPPRQTEPRVMADRTYVTPEGFERRETTILHPPELDDLSDYAGPVLPIEFTHFPEDGPEDPIKKATTRKPLPNELEHQSWLENLMISHQQSSAER